MKVQHKETCPYLTNYSSVSPNPIKLLVINQLEQCCLYGNIIYARMRSVYRTAALALSREELMPREAGLLESISQSRGPEISGLGSRGLWMSWPPYFSHIVPKIRAYFEQKKRLWDRCGYKSLAGIKHYGAHLMSQEKKEAFLPAPWLHACIPACRKTEKILSPSCFTVTTLKYLHDNIWIM